MSSTLGDDQRRRDDESETRSDTMSEMSDYIPVGGSGRGPSPSAGTNPLSVSQMMATEDIDGAPLPPSSLTGTNSERKLGSGVREASEGKSTSTSKRPSSVGRSGGTSASSRLSAGSGGSRAAGLGLGGTSRHLSQTHSSSASTTTPVATPGAAAGAIRRTSFGSSRSISGGAGGANKPSR
jgi:hypothetical protein